MILKSQEQSDETEKESPLIKAAKRHRHSIDYSSSPAKRDRQDVPSSSIQPKAPLYGYGYTATQEWKDKRKLEELIKKHEQKYGHQKGRYQDKRKNRQF